MATIVALECGWIVTEVGRQPWIVYGHMRTEDAVTQAGNIWLSLGIVVVLYAALGTGTVLALRAMSRRWKQEDPVVGGPYAPPTVSAPSADEGRENR